MTSAWSEILHGNAEFRDVDGTLFNKRKPHILTKLARERLFATISETRVSRGSPPIRPDELLISPYSSLLLMEAALASIARPGSVLLVPVPFYKNLPLHTAKFGIQIAGIPTFPPDFRMRPTDLRDAAVRYGSRACGLYLTLPGNPVLTRYSQDELSEIATVIQNFSIPTICDAAFDQVLERSPTLATATTSRGDSVDDLVLTITGNSKGFGASGPCKLGFGMCANVEWVERIQSHLSVQIQRETTLLASILLEGTSTAFLNNLRASMRKQQNRALDELRQLRRRFPHFRLNRLGMIHEGPFLNLSLDMKQMAEAGIHNSLDLEEALLLNQGIDTVGFARMGSPLMAVRLNVFSPRKDSLKDGNLLGELIERLESFLTAVDGGWNFASERRKAYSTDSDSGFSISPQVPELR